MNRPFSVEHISIVEEQSQHSNPASLCGQCVFLSQKQHRKIIDTCNTSITGMAGMTGMTGIPGMPGCCQCPNPNNVTFKFDGNRQVHSDYPCVPNFPQVPQENGHDWLQLHSKVKDEMNHVEVKTSTSDFGRQMQLNHDDKQCQVKMCYKCCGEEEEGPSKPRPSRKKGKKKGRRKGSPEGHSTDEENDEKDTR